VTETLYEPLTAVPSAVAVNAEVLLLLAVSELNALGLSSALNEDWKVERALFRVPTEEISVVTVWVLFEISASCGARVAATSCDTSELTLITEPPAAPALEALATDTGAVVTELLVVPGVLTVVICANLSQ
jgi:hypothetical protein